MIRKIKFSLPKIKSENYQILIGEQLILKLDQLLPKRKYHSLVIITDHLVKKLFANQLKERLDKKGLNSLLLSFKAGEASKTIHTKTMLETKMIRKGCGRDTLILALGGGVVGDVAGFIAATYMRGLDYIQIPSTLLAMVDSSIGGKTGIDTPQGKNLIGAFYQPKKVIIDVALLASLPQAALISGLIEAVKMFITTDSKSFNYFKSHLDRALKGDKKILISIINRAIKIKKEVVQQDEKENSVRTILNFGHTIGHALEKLSGYDIPHGFAVAYGILIEAKIAHIAKILPLEKYKIIRDLFNQLGFYIEDIKKYSVDKIIKATLNDKKTQFGEVQYVLIEDIGAVAKDKNRFTHKVSQQLIKKAFTHPLSE